MALSLRITTTRRKARGDGAAGGIGRNVESSFAHERLGNTIWHDIEIECRVIRGACTRTVVRACAFGSESPD